MLAASWIPQFLEGADPDAVYHGSLLCDGVTRILRLVYSEDAEEMIQSSGGTMSTSASVSDVILSPTVESSSPATRNSKGFNEMILAYPKLMILSPTPVDGLTADEVRSITSKLTMKSMDII